MELAVWVLFMVSFGIGFLMPATDISRGGGRTKSQGARSKYCSSIETNQTNLRQFVVMNEEISQIVLTRTYRVAIVRPLATRQVI